MASNIEPRRATFRSFSESTKEDWDDLTEQYKVVQGRVADRVIEQLEMLRGEFLGYPVDRLEHSLQTATRAERDGRDEEYVVCALVHDIGDSLAPDNHEAIAAAVVVGGGGSKIVRVGCDVVEGDASARPRRRRSDFTRAHK